MRFVISLALAIALSASFSARADDSDVFRDYDSRKAGHPLRVLAYAAHPVGVILDRLIFRPAWWLGSKEPIRTLVGREPIVHEDIGQTEPDGS